MSDLTTTLRRLGELARLQETLPGIAALDASAAVTSARELAAAAKDLLARRDALDDEGRALVERTRQALADGWLTSVTLARLANHPDELRGWLTTARQIDEL